MREGWREEGERGEREGKMDRERERQGEDVGREGRRETGDGYKGKDVEKTDHRRTHQKNKDDFYENQNEDTEPEQDGEEDDGQSPQWDGEQGLR